MAKASGRAALALVALACLACGGPSDAQSDKGDGDSVQKCLEAAGYGDEAPSDIDARRQQDPDFDAAIVNCYRAEGVELPPPGALTRSLDQVVIAEVRCLREKGWDLPDPVREANGGLSMGDLTGVVPEDQVVAFRADDEACIAEIVPEEGRKVDEGPGE